ncbi:MAG: 4a-hydroxytetrahydrobiopterin dehydratase, partial [Candidatus Poseidoniaceae archaeon]|nr:4a-hydroxytetrahydrobiopterin dehydratase [Candidatus Poseidoniaceae archaeon]
MAKAFVDDISILSEDANHHPEIHFGWGYVVIELHTHDEENITDKDLALAHRNIAPAKVNLRVVIRIF